MNSRQFTHGPGFSLVELLTAIAILGVLLCLLLPGIQSAREAARRADCQNNLRQVGVATFQYVAAFKKLPIGAEQNVTFGVSWWVRVVPFLDDIVLMEQFDANGPHAGSVWLHPTNGRLIDGIRIEIMSCPSSSLGALKQVLGLQIMMPSYVGIAGASQDDQFIESRIRGCCLPENKGEISGGGVLIPNSSVGLSQIKDGTSKTLLVGEASAVARNSKGQEFRIDGGSPNGWITGTTAMGVPPNYGKEFAPPSWNITTIRYGINTSDYELPGIHDNRGANNPLLSSHPGGAFGLLVDGSVQFLSNDTDLLSLKRAATRDDGHSDR